MRKFTKFEVQQIRVYNRSSEINQVYKGLNLPSQLTNILHQWEAQMNKTMQEIADVIIGFLPENGVMLDIGSNTGLVSALVLQKKNCYIYMFEPVKEYAVYSQKRLNDNNRIVVENIALGRERGELDFWIDTSNLGWNTFVGEKVTPGMMRNKASVMPFDDYSDKMAISRIDVIKMDVEGAEYLALGGMHNTISRLDKKPLILLEVGWGCNSHPHWDLEVEEFEWLFSHGYERFDYQNISKTTDVLIKPV